MVVVVVLAFGAVVAVVEVEEVEEERRAAVDAPWPLALALAQAARMSTAAVNSASRMPRRRWFGDFTGHIYQEGNGLTCHGRRRGQPL